MSIVCCNGAYSTWSATETFWTGSGGNGCSNPIIVQCGGNYNGNNNTCVDVFEGYWGNGIDVSGYNSTEVVHKLTLTSATSLVLNLTGLTANLDLVVLSACNNYNAIAVSAAKASAHVRLVMPLSVPARYALASWRFRAGCCSA